MVIYRKVIELRRRAETVKKVKPGGKAREKAF